jgi:ATP synthase mitochondrial F1 complex assembly factor 1
VHDVRLLATSQPARSVIERYRDRLEEKARTEGHQDIDALKKSYADKIRHIRDRDAPSHSIPVGKVEDQRIAGAAVAANTLRQTPPPPPRQPSSTTGVKPLDSILDLSKVRSLPVPELTAIWRLRYAADPNSLCAVIPAATYETMAEAGRKHPHFVLPLPQQPSSTEQEGEEDTAAKAAGAGEGGAELHFLQWTFDPSTHSSTVLFTRLAEYKLRGEFAVPHTTVTHHVDLAADKGVVLMQGGVVEGKGVKADEARWLVLCLQRFYGGWDGRGDRAEGGQGEVKAASRERVDERRRLLEWFGSGDERFSVEKLLEEAQRMP